MKVGLIDVDNYKNLKGCYPNIALMKISAWHKQNGDSVEWYDHMKAIENVFRGGTTIRYMLQKYSLSHRIMIFRFMQTRLSMVVPVIASLSERTVKNTSISQKTRNFRTKSST